ncbi:MAG: hypothetical protein Q7S10_03325 [bacterium]|nr:hypothetical protein [bacterium]
MYSEENFKKIIDEARKTVLSPEEKAGMRLNLMDFMAQHPVKNPGLSPWSFLVAVFGKKPALRYSFLIALVAVFGIGSISVAAHGALPGDLLYPIKTEVNEKVLAFTMVSQEQKAQFELGLVQLRLEEIEKVASENTLDDAKSAQVKILLDGHIKGVKDRLNGITDEKKTRLTLEINSELESSLQAHANVIDRILLKKEGEVSGTVKNLLENIRNKKEEAIKTRKSNETELSTRAFDNGMERVSQKRAEAELKIQEVKSIMEAKNLIVSQTTQAKVAADLATIQLSIDGAKAKLEAGDYHGAFIMFQKSIRMLQEVRIYILKEENLKIEFNMPALKSNSDDEVNTSWELNFDALRDRK